MAVAHDATTRNSATAASGSFSHTCTGSDLLLVVSANVRSGSDKVSSITYNSVNLTQLTSSFQGNGVLGTAIWYLINPATGSNTLAWTLSSSDDCEWHANSYTGVDQTTALQNVATTASNTTAPSLTITSSVADGNMTYSTICWKWASGRTMSANGGETERGNGNNASNVGGTSVEEVSAASSTNHLYSFAGTGGDLWALSGCEIVAAAPAAGGGSSSLTLLGVG